MAITQPHVYLPQMFDILGSMFATWQIIAIALCFLWSGFVRSGLGFGGAALTLPLLLIIENDPLLFLPAICWQLLIFSLLTVYQHPAGINWPYLWHLVLRLALPFAAGLVGLLSLSPKVLSIFVYSMTLFYGATYAMSRSVTSNSRLMDMLCIVGGGYVSGVSLIGAPLIVAYSASRLPAFQLRDTLFVMWVVLVIGKLATFAVAGVDLQWQLSALTLPLCAVGHWLGLKAHRQIVKGDSKRFYQVIGCGLCTVSLLGLWSVL